MPRPLSPEARLTMHQQGVKEAIEALGGFKPKVPEGRLRKSSYQSELCEPCGDCPRCRDARRYRARSHLLTKALKLMQELVDAVHGEVSSYDPVEVKQQPTVLSHERVMVRGQRFLTKAKGR